MIRKEKGDKDAAELKVELHETAAPVAEPAPAVETRFGPALPGIYSSTQSSS
jgi:hypothetical protein